jgi:putative pre-16S rRNA nuclease
VRTLGVDLGERRIGLALSDEDGIVASPLATVERTGDRAAVREIARVVREREVDEVVLGLPLRLDGTEGPAAAAAQAFAERLRAEIDRPVHLWDERMTTVLAERAMIEGGARRGERKEKIDRVAAALLLQSFLDAHPRR